MNTKKRRIFRAVAKGGMSQADIAAMLHVSKRDVSLAMKIIRDQNLSIEDIDAMSDVEIAELGNDTSSQSTATSNNYLAPDIAALVEPNEWYLRIEGELMADSILNRIATDAMLIKIDGPNMREYMADIKKE